MTEKYESWDWKYGKNIEFTHQFTRRFPWGGIEFQLQVEHGVVQSANIFTDGLNSNFSYLQEALAGKKYEKPVILHTLENVMTEIDFDHQIIIDVLELVKEKME